MGKPTPEPWTVDQDPMGGLIISGPEGETVFYTGTTSDDEDCANAQLIVDARKTAAERDRLKAVNAELLEALKGAGCICEQDTLETFGRHSDECKAIASAIAKAEGRD